MRASGEEGRWLNINPGAVAMMGEERGVGESSVRYGAGRGGFSLARPRPYTGPGGYVSGNPHPVPVRGPPALIP